MSDLQFSLFLQTPEFMKISQTLQDSQSGGLEKSAWPTTISPDRHHNYENNKKKEKI